MNQLDSTDVAILKIMQEDATLSTRQIAQRVGLSPTPVLNVSAGCARRAISGRFPQSWMKKSWAAPS